MIKLTRLVSDFLLPKIRDSFMRQFAAVSAIEEVEEEEAVSEILAAATTMASISASAAAAAFLPPGGGVGSVVGTPTPSNSLGGVRYPSGSSTGLNGAHRPGSAGPSAASPAAMGRAAETMAAITCSRDIRRKVHGLHGEEKFRAIVYLLR